MLYFVMVGDLTRKTWSELQIDTSRSQELLIQLQQERESLAQVEIEKEVISYWRRNGAYKEYLGRRQKQFTR